MKRFKILICIMVTTPLLICGCSHFNESSQAKPVFREANDLFTQGKYESSLNTYLQIIDKYPSTGDRVLFEMGIIHSHPLNVAKDYQKALECFEKLVKEYPDSWYRKDSEVMAFTINNAIFKDATIATQQKHIATLQQEARSNEAEIAALNKRIAFLEQGMRERENETAKLQNDLLVLQKGPADKILIEKKDRRLTLISKGTVLKTYKIALGGNPDGPKERQGDQKTPEGIYTIDSRKRDSQYHLSLHVSYPNEADRKRARQLGVSPGGDIMIHGIKKELSWVGDRHSEIDWTKGCIAVTDQEIEEISKLVPNGTTVEIRP